MSNKKDKKVNVNTNAYKAEYILKNLKMQLVDGISPTGITLNLKIVRMAKRNYRFIEVYSEGNVLGKIDPYTILSLCDVTTFLMVSPGSFRERIGDMLMIKCPEEIYITKELLKNLVGFKLLTGYVGYGKSYEKDVIEFSPGVLEIFE